VLRNAARRTSRIANGVEREFWTGVLGGMRWGKLRIRDLHTAFDKALTRVEYRAGRSAAAATFKAKPGSPSPGAGAPVPGSNGGGSRPADSANGVSAPAF
jgi:hypothetical protein